MGLLKFLLEYQPTPEALERSAFPSRRDGAVSAPREVPAGFGSLLRAEENVDAASPMECSDAAVSAGSGGGVRFQRNSSLLHNQNTDNRPLQAQQQAGTGGGADKRRSLTAETETGPSGALRPQQSSAAARRSLQGETAAADLASSFVGSGGLNSEESAAGEGVLGTAKRCKTAGGGRRSSWGANLGAASSAAPGSLQQQQALFDKSGGVAAAAYRGSSLTMTNTRQKRSLSSSDLAALSGASGGLSSGAVCTKQPLRRQRPSLDIPLSRVLLHLLDALSSPQVKRLRELLRSCQQRSGAAGEGVKTDPEILEASPNTEAAAESAVSKGWSSGRRQDVCDCRSALVSVCTASSFLLAYLPPFGGAALAALLRRLEAFAGAAHALQTRQSLSAAQIGDARERLVDSGKALALHLQRVEAAAAPPSECLPWTVETLRASVAALHEAADAELCGEGEGSAVGGGPAAEDATATSEPAAGVSSQSASSGMLQPTNSQPSAGAAALSACALFCAKLSVALLSVSSQEVCRRLLVAANTEALMCRLVRRLRRASPSAFCGA